MRGLVVGSVLNRDDVVIDLTTIYFAILAQVEASTRMQTRAAAVQ